jgi:hypothetical protein
MFRVLRRTISILALAGLANSAFAFSLQGPFATWQTAALGYNLGNVDIGGPMNLGEEYRWNIKSITYGFDQSFLNYFGQRGVDEVNKAFAFFNSLPPFSRMSRDLSEFPLDTRKENATALALNLLDLKSTTMGVLAEELGLADPERYVFTLRNRQTLTPPATNYFTVMRNFDPVTLSPSRYVNGTLYTYNIIEGTVGGANFADAQEFPISPLPFSAFNSVAGIADEGNLSVGSLFPGGFFIGLTRDDVGGLRYIYRKTNMNVENLLPNTSGAAGGAAWTPVGNVTNLINLAVRQGIDKFQFKLVKYFGQFQPITNTYTETVIGLTNNPKLKQTKQRVSRVLTTPDIVFAAGDLGVNSPSGSPVLVRRTDTTGWANNSTLNNVAPAGQAEVDGPGVIQPLIVISFSNVGLTFFNEFPVIPVGESDSQNFFGGWGAFDGTTNPPVVFPDGTSILDLEQRIREHGL